MKINIINDWSQVTLRQYNDLIDIQKNEEYEDLIDKGAAMLDILYGIDSMNIPFTDYQLLISRLNKLFETEVKTNRTKAAYKVGDREYWLLSNPAEYTTAQYVDFSNYNKDNDVVGMLSCVIIPKGHLYMDGYDVEQVKDDIGELSICDALGVRDFFVKWSALSINHSLRFLTRRMMKNKKLTKEQKEQMKDSLKQLKQQMNTVLSH